MINPNCLPMRFWPLLPSTKTSAWGQILSYSTKAGLGSLLPTESLPPQMAAMGRLQPPLTT
jgi:hypothetical protein